MKPERGYTLLEAVVVIAVTSSIVGLATGAILSLERTSRMITDTSTSIVGLVMLEKTIGAAAATIVAPPGFTVPIYRRPVGNLQSGVAAIEVPYLEGDPCGFLVVESIDSVTRVKHRVEAHEETLVTVSVPVEFVFHTNDNNLVTLRARHSPRVAFTVRLGGHGGKPVGESPRDRPITESR